MVAFLLILLGVFLVTQFVQSNSFPIVIMLIAIGGSVLALIMVVLA